MLGSALSAYGRIFTPPAVRFSLTGLVARLPISMVGLGIVLLAQYTTGSYAFAGSVSAVALVANAVFAIVQGRLIDRVGQAAVLGPVITVWAVGLGLTMASLLDDWPRWSTYVLAALTGAALPSVGASVRSRWAHLFRDQPSLLHTAFSVEAVADEAVFLFGPILVTVLATAVHPAAGLSAALVIGFVGTWVFCTLRSTEPPAGASRDDTGPKPPMPWSSLIPITVVALALGVLFGAAEVATVAFCDERGHKGLSGFLLATWSFGSLIAGLIAGAITWRASTLVRLRVGACAMALTMAPLALVPSIPVMLVVLLFGGLAISPTLIAAVSLAEQVLPAVRLNEGLAFFSTGISTGLAPGAAVTGLVIDEYGASPAYLVCLVGGATALLAALAIRVER